MSDGKSTASGRTYKGWATACMATVALINCPAICHAQSHPCSGLPWRPPGALNVVPIYWNPGTLAANGFNVNAFRNSFLNAVALWNEESHANLQLLYMGDTSSTNPIAGAIVVKNINQLACGSGLLGLTQWPGGYSYLRDASPLVSMVLQDSCSGAVRPWVPGQVPGNFFSYEAVLAHELGHAVFDLPDRYAGACAPVLQDTIMFSYGRATAALHLYPVDVNTARARNGNLGFGRPYASDTADLGVTFSGRTTLLAGSTIDARMTPAIASRFPSSDLVAVVADQFVGRPFSGVPGSWTAQPVTINPTGFYSQPAVAFSEFGETLATWNTSCTAASDCSVSWAWSNNNGASWTTGAVLASNPFGAGTYTRTAVAYDRFRDRFVMAFIEGNSRQPSMISSPAASPSWTSPGAVANFTPPNPMLRSMGGMVFDGSGGGLLVAVSDETATYGQIFQYPIISNPAGGYFVDPAQTVAGPGYATWFTARRSIGLARRPSDGRIFMAWRSMFDGDVIATAHKTSISASATFSVRRTSPFTSESGVDTAFVFGSARFAISFAGNP